ncbi:MAG: Polyamine aminopropyltransferase [Anaerolineales bacterium]|nr:Polyamine aminopropyltransferase [Anaerolineales bacterium]WKZ46661.1 MAG: fused MFS/spermidine synthase [Anaerolineales bacterium]
MKRKFNMQSIFSVLFFMSGFAAIAFQVIWQKVLAQIIGVDSVSVAIIIIIFMAGLGFGTLSAAYFIERFKDKLLFYYSVINILIGIYGFFSLWIMRGVNKFLILVIPSSVLSDLLINFLIMFLPIFLMGMTTPIVIELMKNNLETLGKTEGFFYGINTFGSAVGALATNFVLIEWLNFTGTIKLASTLYVIVSLIVFVIYHGNKNMTPVYEAGVAIKKNIKGLGFALIVPSFLFGFSSLALEMILFRVLSNYLTMSALVYPVMLSSVLVLMAVGNYVGGLLIDRGYVNKSRLILRTGISSLVLITVPFLISPSVFARVGALVFTSFNGQLVSDIPYARIGDPDPFISFFFSLVFMIGMLPLASLFPIIARISTTDIGVAGNRFAFVLFWYTVGNILGSFLTGLFFFEWFGTIGSLVIILALISLGISSLLSSQREKSDGLYIKQIATLGVVLGICFLVIPRDYYMRFKLGDYKPVKTYEGRNGVVTVIPTDRFYTIIDMFRTASASAIVRDPEPYEQYEAWRWNMSQMMALDPAFRPKRVLIIGLGHGYLVNALLDYDFVEEIIIVDISDEIVRAVKDYTGTPYQRMFNDPRVKIVIDDGRRYAQKALVLGERFDLIQNKVNEPWHSGSASLFTVEFFNVLHDLLTPNGYIAVRPKVGHAVDALEIFESVIWPSGDYHMYFGRNQNIIFNEAVVTDDIYSEYFATTPGFDNASDSDSRDSEMAVVILHSGDLVGYRNNTDDHPVFEYYWINDITHQYMNPRIDISLDQSNNVVLLPVYLRK